MRIKCLAQEHKHKHPSEEQKIFREARQKAEGNLVIYWYPIQEGLLILLVAFC